MQVYSLALIFDLWGRDHYRSGTFQADMVKNLRNVAIPGTGISLRWVCYFKVTAYLFLLVAYPIVGFVSALNRGRVEKSVRTVFAAYREQLLQPQVRVERWQPPGWHGWGPCLLIYRLSIQIV